MADAALSAGNAARETIENMGFEMADVEYVREDGQMCLNFYICKPGGVNIDDCESVSRAIDEIVENADPTKGKPYCLCVSTWGDRPLKTPRDFERNIGTEVEVKLKKATEGKKKKFIGILQSADEEKVVLIFDGDEKAFEKNNIDSVRPYIGF